MQALQYLLIGSGIFAVISLLWLLNTLNFFDCLKSSPVKSWTYSLHNLTALLEILLSQPNPGPEPGSLSWEKFQLSTWARLHQLLCYLTLGFRERDREDHTYLVIIISYFQFGPRQRFNPMDLKKISILLLCLVIYISGYSIRIDPVLNTHVQAKRNTGNSNKIQLQSISNSTILQSLPNQVYQSHVNELIYTTIILIAFGLIFLVISGVITKISLVLFKLNQRVLHLEAIFN